MSRARVLKSSGIPSPSCRPERSEGPNGTTSDSVAGARSFATLRMTALLLRGSAREVAHIGQRVNAVDGIVQALGAGGAQHGRDQAIELGLEGAALLGDIGPRDARIVPGLEHRAVVELDRHLGQCMRPLGLEVDRHLVAQGFYARFLCD